MVRTYLDVSVLITDDDAQRQTTFERTHVGFDDNDDTRNAQYTQQRVTLAGGATDQAVDLGGITTGTFLYIEALADVNVKLNGSNVALPLKYVPASVDGVVLSNLQRYSQPAVLLLHGDVTSISLTNPSATTAISVLVALVGT